MSFQKLWYEKYPWPQVSSGTKGVLCYFCLKYFEGGKLSLASKIDQSFVSTGFTNWKKAHHNFKLHAVSARHKFAKTTVANEHN